MTLDKTLVTRMYRKYTAMEQDIEDFAGYDDIIAMKWEGIPSLKEKEWYVEFIDTRGRDTIQQATNIFSTQRPKWDVLPRGLGDIDTAGEFERTIEWYMWKASQIGEQRFHEQALLSAVKYNRVCAQLEWMDDYSFCVKIYHPSTVLYEYGTTLQWVSVVNNVTGASIIEHWKDFAKEGWEEKVSRGDKIGKALKEISDATYDDPEQRYMYVDYTDKDRRYTYCYPVTSEDVDDSFGLDDDGKPNDDVILIQDKSNKLGFINWAIASGIGEPILSPLLKGGQYDRINDEETILRSKVMRKAFEADWIKEGREDVSVEIDNTGDESVMEVPTGVRLQKVQPSGIDPAFAQLINIDRGIINESIGLSSSADMQVSNVQHSTIIEQIKLRQSQLEQPKRVTEQAFTQIAYLIFRWAKKKDKVLVSQVLHDSRGQGQDYKVGQEISITPDQINLDALYIKCTIMPSTIHDRLQIANQIGLMKQSGLQIPDDEYIEMFDMGDPDIQKERYEEQELRKASLQMQIQQMQLEMQEKFQIRMKEIDMQMQLQMQQMQMQIQQGMMQQQMAQAQGAVPMQGMAGNVAPQQGIPLPSDGMTQGQGFDAGMGGMPPQVANAEITQSMR